MQESRKQFLGAVTTSTTVTIIVVWALLQVTWQGIDTWQHEQNVDRRAFNKTVIERYDKISDRLDALMLDLISAEILTEETGTVPDADDSDPELEKQ